MLTLPIKKKWYDMILSGEKKEEYREIKPYYTSRFMNVLGETFYDGNENWKNAMFEDFIGECRYGWFADEPFDVVFRNGYSAKSPSFQAKVTLHVGEGKPEWGAEPGVEYYILQIKEVLQ